MKKLLMILTMALTICFVFSCQNQETMAEIEAQRSEIKPGSVMR